MQLTSLGFAFLLLPITAALYHCVPNRFKTVALVLCSAGFYLLMEPAFAPLVLLSLGCDCLFSWGLSRLTGHSHRAGLLYALAAFKNIGLIAWHGLYLPFSAGLDAPVGLIVVSLSSLCILRAQRLGRLPGVSPVGLAAGSLFFGKLIYGPVAPAAALLARPAPSLSLLGQGIMLFTTGIAKRAILVEQLMALYKTLARLPVEQVTVTSAWLAALCAALGIYFTLSSYGDIAVGLGRVFSIELPRPVYYPLQAPGVRDYVYRFNMPLEEALGSLIFREFNRDAGGWKPYLVSALTPLALALWLSPTPDFLLWGLWLTGLVLLDWIILRRVPLRLGPLARVTTFLLTLPSYVLLLPTDLSYKLAVLRALVGRGAASVNDAVLYLIFSNLPLLLLCLAAGVSAADTLGRLTARQFPRLWWVLSALFHAAVLFLTLSFLIWNVR